MRFLVALLFISNAYAKDLCFPSGLQAYHLSIVYDKYAKMLVSKFASIKKQLQPTTVKVSNKCDHCLEIEGDPYIKGVIEEMYEKLEIDKLGKETIPGIPVDVSMGRLIPVEAQNGHIVFNPHYIPFLSLPKITSNVFYDSEKTPVEVSGRMVHPKYMEYTFKYKDREHTVTEKIDRAVVCMFPYDPKNEEDVKFFKSFFEQKYMKEGERFLPIKDFEIKAFLRLE